MEAVVSRMKTVQVAINNEVCKTGNQVMRFIAVSATIPNVDDVILATFPNVDEVHIRFLFCF